MGECDKCQLRTLDCFSINTDAELSFIEQFKNNEITLNAGDSLYRENAISSQLYTLKSGWAFRFRTFSDGSRQILNILLPGDFIGLQAELNKAMPNGVETLTKATFCVFPREKIMEVYKQFPTLGYDLTWLCAHEELIVDENLTSVGQRNAEERMAMLFISLYKRANVLGIVEKGHLSFPLNQQHIADALGLSLVHTNKTLAKLKTKQICEINQQTLRIYDLAKMQRLAEYQALPMRKRPLI
jgi:CRP/FNR family transcriptional regulator, anaerobic regulatory protein